MIKTYVNSEKERGLVETNIARLRFLFDGLNKAEKQQVFSNRRNSEASPIKEYQVLRKEDGKNTFSNNIIMSFPPCRYVTTRQN